MGIEENKESMKSADISKVDELTIPSFVSYDLSTKRKVDRDTMKNNNARLQLSLSDVSVEIDDIVGEGDRVALRMTLRGKHMGQMFNIAPTNAEIEGARVMFFRLKDGKIAELWMLNDNLKLFQDMGVLPPLNEIGN
jgi:predicted ester cyclase